MPWLQLSVAADRDGTGAVAACLEAHGAVAVSLSGAGEEVLLEPAPGAEPLWNQVRLQALFDPASDVRALKAALAGLNAQLLDVAFLADDDWQSRWRSHAVRACFAGRLWLLPRDEPFDPPALPGGGTAVVLRLDPGLAFGSGSHPTTRLCLGELGSMSLEGLRVLDYGSGSGILGLAASLLGAGRVVAVDHDPQALLATRDNATYNHIKQSQLRVMTPEELTADAGAESLFDVVVANILARPLTSLAPMLTRFTADQGRLLLSGLLVDQEPMIRSAYPEVAFSPPVRDGDWICLHGRRRRRARHGTHPNRPSIGRDA